MDDPSGVPGTPQAVPDVVVRAHKLDAVGRLVPGVIHELNNPLSAIVGFGELLRTDPRLPADMRQHAELLVRETGRTQRLIQATLEFLRTRPPERMPTSIRALVDAVLLLHGYRLLSTSIQVEQDVPADLPQVELDRSSMQLVLVDLVQGAIDAALVAGGRGRLRIKAAHFGERGREQVALTVAWTVGAPADGPAGTEAPDVHRETARRVAAAIVAEHGGRLHWTQTADGGNASVTIELPVRAGSLPETTRVGAGHPSTDNGGDVFGSMSMPTKPLPKAPVAPDLPVTRVLVLDDERSIRLLLEKWLRVAGFEPVIASTGEEAVALVAEAPFDAVLCDHRMAGMNGTDVFEAVVAIRPELERRFVFMSGDILNPQLRDFVDVHGVGLLAKPFDLAAVRRTLDGVLAGEGSPLD